MQESSGKILFIGGRKHGHLLLQRMLEMKEEIVGVFGLVEDEHEPVRFDAQIEARCRQHGVPVTLCSRLTRDHVEAVKQLRPDLIVVMGWRTLIPPSVLDVVRCGCVGLHDALLPKYRGFAPLNWAIINGESETGVTLFYMNEAVDAGDIIAQKAIPIDGADTAATMYEKVCEAAVSLVLEHLPAMKQGRVPARPQQEAEATYGCARSPQDGLINWKASAREIYNLIRALTWPYPGAFTYYQGQRLTIWKASLVDGANRYVGAIPGRVVRILRGRGVEVLTGDGVLLAEQVQRVYGDPTTADTFLKSIRATLGLHPVDLEAMNNRLEQVVSASSQGESS